MTASRWATWILLFSVASQGAAFGATQTVELEAGWNLISFQLEPTDPSITSVLASISGTYEEVWTYDALSVPAAWIGYQPGGVQTLTELHGCIGYWIRMDDALVAPVELDVVGQPKTGGVFLAAGWNLVGYYSERLLPIGDAWGSLQSTAGIHGLAPNGGEWLSYVGSAPEYVNTLTEILPGRGYWVYVPEDTLWNGPLLGVSHPHAPIDVVDVGGVGAVVLKSGIMFGSGPDEYSIRIYNVGDSTRSLTWEVLSPQDWLIQPDQNAPWSGQATTETDVVTVGVDWTLLPVGTYDTVLSVESNGGAITIPVRATKRSIEGHYRGFAIPKTVNGKQAALPYVKLGMDIGPQGDWALITAEETPFFPDDVYFQGSGDDENLIVGATFPVAPNDAAGRNILAEVLVRSVTMRGSRTSNTLIEGGAVGDYVETIEASGAEPVVIRGTFQLIRTGDLDTYLCPASNECPIPKACEGGSNPGGPCQTHADCEPDGTCAYMEERPRTTRTDRDGDGLPDDWEIRFGLNPTDPCDWTNDPDGDTRSNCQEYVDRTDPRTNDTSPEPVSISGRVTENADPDPLPVAHVPVSLHFATQVLTTSTDPSGAYSFEGLVPGYYTISFGPFPGFSFSPTSTSVTIPRGAYALDVVASRHTTTEAIDFAGAPLQGNSPLTVQFTALKSLTASDPTFWLWQFGDGDTSQERDPRHTYTAESSEEFTARLITDVAPAVEKINYVRVGPPSAPAMRMERSVHAILGGHSVPCAVLPGCDDGNSCTTDACEGGICVHPWIECPVGETCNSGTGLCEPGGQALRLTLQAVFGNSVSDEGQPSTSEHYQLWVDDLP